MARTKADSYTKAAVKAPRKVSVLTGGQASNVKAGSTSKGTGNSYCPRPKPVWQLSVDSFFPKAGEPFELKKPVETAVSSDEMVEGSCSVDESDSESAGPVDEVDSENAGPSKSADDVDSEMAGSSKSADDVDSEMAGSSKSADDVDSEMAGSSKSADDVDSEMAGSSESADDVDNEVAGIDMETLCPVKFVFKRDIINPNPLSAENYFFIDDDTYVIIDEDELF